MKKSISNSLNQIKEDLEKRIANLSKRLNAVEDVLDNEECHNFESLQLQRAYELSGTLQSWEDIVTLRMEIVTSRVEASRIRRLIKRYGENDWRVNSAQQRVEKACEEYMRFKADNPS